MNDREILAAALRWHTAHARRLLIGAENARRLRTYPSRPVARQVMMPQARCTKAR